MDHACSVFLVMRIVFLFGMPVALSGCGNNELPDQAWPLPPDPVAFTGDSYAGSVLLEPIAGRPQLMSKVDDSVHKTLIINRGVITHEPLVAIPSTVYLRSRDFARTDCSVNDDGSCVRALPNHISPLASRKISSRPHRAENDIKDAGESVVYIVRQDDTLYAISRHYGIDVQEIAKYNGLSSLDAIFLNQRLVIPVHDVMNVSARSMMPKITPVPSFRQEYATIALPMLRSFEVFEDSPVRQMRSSVISAREPIVASGFKQTNYLTSQKFRWPVRGRILSKFGVLPSGKRNDGINISTPEGASIKAAEGGVVAYAGNDLKGYGQLILIRHKADWVTAYAHNSKIMVHRGDKVRRGQIVAKAGKTGNVDQPQLHFEIRHDSKPMNPIGLFFEG